LHKPNVASAHPAKWMNFLLHMICYDMICCELTRTAIPDRITT
jgi:hypothetical protein